MIKKSEKKSDTAQYLFHQGTNYSAYDFMGVHPESKDGQRGFRFRTWAPNADQVFVTGDFNGWTPGLEMVRESQDGLWSAFISEGMFGEYSKYKYIIRRKGKDFYKADPYGFFCEKPPETASVYVGIDSHSWNDNAWLSYRKKTFTEPKYETPINIYEVHAGSWKRNDDGSYLGYRQLAEQLAPYVKQMGYTHVELMPISEHPFDGSWGYQVCGYYAPSARYGTPEDFMYFVDYMHQSGIGVILDWVPAHFPKDAHGLYEFDGSPLYEYQGVDKMEHEEWGTRRFDVGRNEVECFLISNALFWLKKYHLDGLRVDAVSSMLYLDYGKKPGEWLPNSNGGNECLEAVAFFQKLGSVLRDQFPDALFIAEESTAWPCVSKPAQYNGLGFNYKWNMGWMNDSLSYFETDPLFRKHVHDKLTFSMVYAFSENYILPISHDEVVHGKKSLLDKMPGDYWQKFAGTRAFLAYMMTHPGKKLLFMGCEIGQFREWDYEGSIEWFLLDYEMHSKIQSYVRDLNFFYLEHSQLWEIDYSWDGFKWINADDRDSSVISYIRYNRAGEILIVILNFTPVPRENYKIGVPHKGRYREIFNSDSDEYGGSGMKNPSLGAATKEKGKLNDFDYSLSLSLPPLGAVILEEIIDGR